MPVQRLKRLQADVAQARTAQLLVHLVAQRIELQVQLEARHVGRQPFDEFGILRDAQAVGVDHQVADWPPFRRVEDVEELRVQRRLAAGDLHDVRLALVGDDGIEHALDRRHVAEARAMRAGVGVADRAAQVAVVGDLDQGQAAVLHVLRAQAAVVGAAPLALGVEALRQLRRLDEALAAEAVILDVVGDQHALAAVLRAPLLQVDPAVLAVLLEQDGCLDATQAGRTHRHRGVVEQVRSYLRGHASAFMMRGRSRAW